MGVNKMIVKKLSLQCVFDNFNFNVKIRAYEYNHVRICKNHPGKSKF